MSIRISVLVSGGGSNLQALLDAQDEGKLGKGKIVQVISSRKDAFALNRAANHGVLSTVIDQNLFPDSVKRNEAVLRALQSESTDIVVLAGYMKVLSPQVVEAYPGRIVNIHPSLIPKHCGKGMYGIRVHQSVIASGEKESGATVHLVDEGVDTGKILVQERVPVFQGDTPEALAQRVLAVEHKILPAAVRQLVDEIERKR
jgi:phosphoribosylglycinamide formyltransferase 1